MKKIIMVVVLVIVVAVGIQWLFPYNFQEIQQPIRYDYQGNILIGDNSFGWEGYKQIPQNLRTMIITTEDKNFYRHWGIDLKALGRALFVTLTTDDVQGGSTITQQLVKLDKQQFTRSRFIKLSEAWSALNISLHYSKKDVFLRYVNLIPWSGNVQGWRAACQYFYGKECEWLSDSEYYVLLAASQLGANIYNTNHQQGILDRAIVLCKIRTGISQSCDGFSLSVFDSLVWEDKSPDPRIRSMILDAYKTNETKYNPDIAQGIESILKNTRSQRNKYNVQNCCVVVIDDTGSLVSMNMCADWDDNENSGRVISCLLPRQTGSAAKPFLYTYGFNTLSIGSDDLVVDEYISYDLGDGSLYEPKNFDLNYHGVVTWAYALGNSLNIPAVKLLHAVGVEEYLSFLQEELTIFNPGIILTQKDAENVGLSLALGTYEISPYHFTKLWGLFLPGQERKNPGYKKSIKEVISILKNPLNKVDSFGQDNYLIQNNRAVKTGTSRKFIDGWICGVGSSKNNNHYSVCIWLGNINNEPMNGSSAEIGGFIRSQILDVIDEF